MTELTKETFETEVLNSPLPTVVDFFATWCAPCRMLSPILESVVPSYEGKANFFKLDIDKAEEIALAYGVMSIPTLIIFDKGEVITKTVGVLSAEELTDWLDENI